MAQTPLHVSAGYDRAEIIKFLLDWQGPEKAELEAKNMVGKHFIYYFFNLLMFSFENPVSLLGLDLLDSSSEFYVLTFVVWGNSIAYGSQEWM